MAKADVRRTVLIVTAGQSKSGKSTAMNNIFGADFEHKHSVFPVTREVQSRCIDGYTDELIVVDTPGLGSTDIDLKTIKKQIIAAIGGLNFVLVYCYQVGPGSVQTVTDKLVVKNLQKVLGKDIWKKCVVLFTFCDFLRQQEFSKQEDRESYNETLKTHADDLSRMLREECGPHVPDVKPVFKVDQGQNDIPEIVAVPVGRKWKVGREVSFLVPGTDTQNWPNIALREIIRKADPMDRDVYSSFRYPSVKVPLSSSITGGVVSGAAVGAVSGGAIGFVAGGVGFLPGALAGAGLGAAAGLIGGGLSGAGVIGNKHASVKANIEAKNEQIRKLKENRINRNDPQPPEEDLMTSDTDSITTTSGCSTIVIPAEVPERSGDEQSLVID